MNESVISHLEKLIEDLRKGVYNCVNINTEAGGCLTWEPDAAVETWAYTGESKITISLQKSEMPRFKQVSEES